MAYRGGSDIGLSSSSPPRVAASPSPPSSPTYARSTSASHAIYDPFSASAKSLSLRNARRPSRWSRSVTTPAAPLRDGVAADLSQAAARGDAADVLSHFFDEKSDDSLASSVDTLSHSSPTRGDDVLSSLAGMRRPFSRTDSASTDPLSAAGRPEPDARHAPRRRIDSKHGNRSVSPADAASLDDDDMDDAGKGRVVPATQGSTVQWDAEVARVFDEARERPALLLGGSGVTYVGGVVGDLRHYVSFNPSRAGAALAPVAPLQFYLWDNCLTRLPSALFQLTNLGVLSLRKNQLTSLPPAIGELLHLRELNIGGNRLTYLPAEIQRLRLETFTYVPNPFLAVPPGAVLDVRSWYGAEETHTQPRRLAAAMLPPRWTRSHTDDGAGPRGRKGQDTSRVMARVLGALERTSLPTLAELCLQRLLSDTPPTIEQYETGSLRAVRTTLDTRLVARLEAARRSATATWGSSAAHSSKAQHERWFASGAPPSQQASVAADMDTTLELRDDACENMWFNTCPGAHGAQAPPSDVDWPSERRDGPYARAAEQRIEWVSHVAGVRVAKQGIEMAGAAVRGMPAEPAGCLPLLWRGCSFGCLEFLERTTAPPDAPR